MARQEASSSLFSKYPSERDGRQYKHARSQRSVSEMRTVRGGGRPGWAAVAGSRESGRTGKRRGDGGARPVAVLLMTKV
jgi:hypothetical protein